MKVGSKNYRTVWLERSSVFLINQDLLPFRFEIVECKTYLDTCRAIKTMLVRGAGAIGAAGGFALAQAFLSGVDLKKARQKIENTRPTAQNLFFALEKVFNSKDPVKEAQKIADEDAACSKKIGEIGSQLIKDGMQIETHCNAGWLAFVDYGTALSPLYAAHREGKKIFVYVDETGPRRQGARLTAWELLNAGIPFVILPDTAGAFMMSQGKIDLMIVGADRIAANGDTANKIGTLEKAICAKEFGIPFYVAAPTSTFDLGCKSGKDIPIEERSPDEVLYQSGISKSGKLEKILVCAPGAGAVNPAFDLTPARYISGIITEKGIIKPKDHP